MRIVLIITSIIVLNACVTDSVIKHGVAVTGIAEVINSNIRNNYTITDFNQGVDIKLKSANSIYLDYKYWDKKKNVEAMNKINAFKAKEVCQIYNKLIKKSQLKKYPTCSEINNNQPVKLLVTIPSNWRLIGNVGGGRHATLNYIDQTTNTTIVQFKSPSLVKAKGETSKYIANHLFHLAQKSQ